MTPEKREDDLIEDAVFQTDESKGKSQPNRRWSLIAAYGLVIVLLLGFLFALFVKKEPSEDSRENGNPTSEVQPVSPTTTSPATFEKTEIFTDGPGEDAGTGGGTAP